MAMTVIHSRTDNLDACIAMEEKLMSTLEHAIALAAQAHAGQVDKAGAPYILHPLRVMMQLQTDEERMAGILHDVVEDSAWTLEGLRAEGFSEQVIGAVDACTRRAHEDYEDFVLRAAAHSVGRAVKLADLADNMDISRISNPTEHDYKRVAKYRRASAHLHAEHSC